MPRPRNRISKVCIHCGKVFETFPSSIAKGGGKFCSRSCATTYRNLTDNPAWNTNAKMKISRNHADVSGPKNPMYLRRGKEAPGYIDGRNSYKGETYRRILLASGAEPICELCGSKEHLHVHHKDKNHRNNTIENLAWLCVKCHNNVAHARRRDKGGRFIKESDHYVNA